MGGPSAALVLADLAKLGVRRAIRIGTCMPVGGRARSGELLLVEEAIAVGGSATAFGAAVGEAVIPDAGLSERLRDALGGDARTAKVASFDAMPTAADGLSDVDAADLQTVAVLARAHKLEMAAAAVLIAAEEGASGERLAETEIEEAATRAGEAAALVLST